MYSVCMLKFEKHWTKLSTALSELRQTGKEYRFLLPKSLNSVCIKPTHINISRYFTLDNNNIIILNNKRGGEDGHDDHQHHQLKVKIYIYNT